MTPHQPPTSPLRFYCHTPKRVWKAIAPHTKKKRIHVEHVYFDTGHPSLFYTGFVRARRVVEEDAPLFDLDALFYLEFRADADTPVKVAEAAVTLRDIPEAAEAFCGVSGLIAIIGVRFERISADAEGVHLDVDVDTTYFSLRATKPFEVGREDAARLTLRSTGAHGSREELEAIRDRVEHAPCTAKKWMGFYFVKQCYELPRHDEHRAVQPSSCSP